MIAKRFLAGLLTVPALVAGTVMSDPASAQTPAPPTGADIPSVGVAPIGTKSSDPNSGQWFIGAGGPGTTIKFRARLANPAQVPQTVKMSLADLDFGDDGTPTIAETSDDIGTWGTVTPASVTIDALKSIEVPFEVTVPVGADPGDHVGVFMIEGQPHDAGSGQLFKVVKRVATRMYVTVPGDARADVAIESVDVTPDSSFFAREVTVRVVLRNRGRVRLTPTVTVNGKTAKGPDTILSSSVEPYLITQKVPFWGGPQSYRVDVVTKIPSSSGAARNGPARQARVSKFFIPYVPTGGAVLVVAALFGLRSLLRRRTGKYAALQADLRRVEKLLGDKSSANGDSDTSPADPVVAIKQAIKQAVRAGDKATEAKLRAKLVEPEVPPIAPTPAVPTSAPPAPAPVARPHEAPQHEAPDPIAVALGLVAPAQPAAQIANGANGDEHGDEDEEDEGGDTPFELPMLAGERAGFSPMEPTDLGGTIVNRSE